MQKARSQGRHGLPRASPPTACRRAVSGSLSLPARGCFSPVPHGTRPLSVTRESLALEGGPPGFTPDYSGRALLRNSTTPAAAFAYRAVTVFGAPFQGTSAGARRRVRGSYNPAGHAPRFGLRPFRSPLLRASRLISLPPGTEMFQFPGFASVRRLIPGLAPRWVPPFGHLGLSACVRLPRAFRSLPRPSSPSCAQASPTRLRSLDYTSRQAEHAHRVGFRRPS
jgi:hypothetical protein